MANSNTQTPRMDPEKPVWKRSWIILLVSAFVTALVGTLTNQFVSQWLDNGGNESQPAARETDQALEKINEQLSKLNKAEQQREKEPGSKEEQTLEKTNEQLAKLNKQELQQKKEAGSEETQAIDNNGRESVDAKASTDAAGRVAPSNQQPMPVVAGKVVTNSIGMKLVTIPSGTYTMGSDVQEDDERPSHRVNLTKAFEMGLYEVTQGEYEIVMGKNPSQFQPAIIRSSCTGQRFPVNMVNWSDAVEFCRKLSELPREKASRRRYRLPTEAEWEYACRAGTATAWSFGNEERQLDSYAWFAGNANGKIHRVGEKKPNAWGIYDMHGNVAEWCQDRYGEYLATHRTDPTGPTTGSYSVLRGGAAWYENHQTRSASRQGDSRELQHHYFGFRVVCDIE